MDKKSFALGVALLAGTATASAEGLGISVNTGLVGLGIGTGADITYSVHPMLNVRGGFMSGTKSLDATVDANEFSITSKASTMGVYADWLIFQGDLRLTAGYVTNGGSLNLATTGTVDYGGGVTITESFAAEITFKPSPYIGIGWGNSAEAGDTFGFNMDIGVLLDANPSVSITQSSATAQQKADLESDIAGDGSIKALPVITVGLTYHF